MEGILQKYDTAEGGWIKNGEWKEYYFILHENILMFTEVQNKAKVIGKLHLEISKIMPDNA